MGHRSEPGKILENTYLIDGNFFGIKGALATYVVRGQQSALVDSGTREGANDIIQALRSLGLFPVDKIILTHEHWDHTQGAVSLIQAMGPDVTVYASRKAKPIIEDPTKMTYDYGVGTIEPVKNIIPLEEGDVVNLGGVELEIMDVPGHTPGHIALYDRANRNIFLGDSIGNKIDPTTFLPSHNPPWFDKEAFYRTLANLKKAEFNTVCLAHYGCWDALDAENILDEARLVFDNFWNFFETNRDRLDDVNYLAASLMERYLPDAKPASAEIGIFLVGWLRDGFKQYYHLR
jgi:glyoxylase-like metal-dependent hydrolase (beta-lactamase superfamily II)